VKAPLNETIGDRWLSAWLVAPGVTWVQTRSPEFARKLSRRGDSRFVARGVCGGYLRTFEFCHGLAWAKRLIGRYSKNERATGMGINPVPCLNEPSKAARGMTGAREPIDKGMVTNARINSPLR
jgi:hypothetical protein